MTYHEQIEYEAALHRKYFEPFDQLLEKKAQYYLGALEAGKSEKQLWPMLHEIEVLERFREYAAMLETLFQGQVDQTHNVARTATHWKRENEESQYLWRVTMQVADHYKRQLEHLKRQSECNPPSTK